MICESCGSRIPDGAKFCTECGAKAPEPTGTVPEVILPDIPDVVLPDIPDIPDVILPGAPVIPDISQSVVPDEDPAPEESAAEPAWTTVSQTPIPPARPAAEEVPPEAPWSTVSQTPIAPEQTAAYGGAPDAGDGSSFGYSTVNGYAYVPPDVPDAASKPLYKRWWFWLLIGIGVVALVVALIASLIVYSMRNVMPSIDEPDLEAILTQTEDLTDIDKLPDILENFVDDPDAGDEFALDIDDNYTPMDILTEEIDRVLTGMGLEHEVYVDEDDWVFIDVWTDGIDGLAESAYEGDDAALAEWNAVTENIRELSESFLSDLRDGGQHSAVCAVSLIDDMDKDLSLAIAVDGELILDLVTGLDEYDLMED